MKAIVTGGQRYTLTSADYQFLERSVAVLRVKDIYTNGLPGVPEQVAAWAKRRGLRVWRVTANFMHDGPATPEERNTTLLTLAKVVIAFPGGNECADLVAKARKARLAIHESPGRTLANPPTMDTGLRQRSAPSSPRLKINP